MTTDIPAALAEIFADGQRRREEAVNRALATLRPYERRLVREAAVMGYVRGAMAGRSRATHGETRDGDIPSDAAILADVLGACISMSDIYPYIATAANGRRRPITKARRWPGEEVAQ